MQPSPFGAPGRPFGGLWSEEHLVVAMSFGGNASLEPVSIGVSCACKVMLPSDRCRAKHPRQGPHSTRGTTCQYCSQLFGRWAWASSVHPLLFCGCRPWAFPPMLLWGWLDPGAQYRGASACPAASVSMDGSRDTCAASPTLSVRQFEE